MQKKLIIRTFILSSLTLIMLTACDAKKAYYIARGLLGYIPPPKVPSIMDQLKEELERCERAGDENCPEKAFSYVRLMNKSLERKPLKGRVIITEGGEGETTFIYDPEAKEADDKAPLEKD